MLSDSKVHIEEFTYNDAKVIGYTHG